MKLVLKNIRQNPVFATWLSLLCNAGRQIVVLPFILNRFDDIEVSIWFMFFVIQGMAVLANMGFGSSIVRAVSYFYSGAATLPDSLNGYEKHETVARDTVPNTDGLLALIGTSFHIYFFIGIIGFISICGIGTSVVWNLIEKSGHKSNYWAAFAVLVIASVVDIRAVLWNSFMQGFDQVAKFRFSQAILYLCNTAFFVIVILLNGGLLSLMLGNLIVSIVLYFYFKKCVYGKFEHLGVKERITKNFDKNLFNKIWPATWRFGAITWGGYLIIQANSIVVAQLENAKVIATFLFTQRLLFMIRNFSQAPIYAGLPQIFRFIAKKDFLSLRRYSGRAIFYSLFMLVTALIFVGLFTNPLLQLLKIDFRIIPFNIYVIMAVSLVLEMHHCIHTQIYIGTNHVPFLWPSLISGAAIISLGFTFVGEYGLLGLVIIQMLVQIAFNNWFSVYLSLRLSKWTFSRYIIDMLEYGAMPAVKKLKRAAVGIFSH